ncbi:Phosphate ABC transporter, periplasmic phosphate-binding protein PstS [Planctomycetales bacterium 10988]|nr:Phosphate ABC transporter, periplasmic phosphate-binding protein PstS [Planctomycetales bacterium 10988]
MQRFFGLSFLFAALTMLPLLQGCTGSGPITEDQLDLEGKIEVDGSSTVYPITEAIATGFLEIAPDVSVTVGVSGTGGGFKRFTANETDISDASRPIKSSEFESAKSAGVKFIEVPVAYDGLTIVVNPDNDWADEMTVEDLQKIFLEGGAKTWKEVKDSYPDSPIKIFAPGTDSGTFDYFKEVVAEDDGTIRSDNVMSTSEDDNVLVTGVAGEKGAIGFFGASYFFENEDKLKAVKIINPDGDAIAPTAETIEDGSYAPFSRPLFIYLKLDSMSRPEMQKFVEYYMENAGEKAASVGYVALPQAVYDTANSFISEEKTGTCYLTEDMEKRGGAVSDVYKAENLTSF